MCPNTTNATPRWTQLLPVCTGAGTFAALVTIDSFLLDPLLLFANGFLWGFIWKLVWQPRGKARALPIGLGLTTLLCYWGVSASLYFNGEWIAWLARGCGAHSGRDWMLNSGVFHFDYESPGLTTHVVSAVIFATYPLWLALGGWAGTRAVRGSAAIKTAPAPN